MGYAIVAMSSAVLFRLIVWEHLETHLFMLKCKRNVKKINKMFADLEKKIDDLSKKS